VFYYLNYTISIGITVWIDGGATSSIATTEERPQHERCQETDPAHCKKHCRNGKPELGVDTVASDALYNKTYTDAKKKVCILTMPITFLLTMSRKTILPVMVNNNVSFVL